MIWRGYTCKGSHCAVPVCSHMRVRLASRCFHTCVCSDMCGLVHVRCVCVLSKLCSHMGALVRVLSYACATWRIGSPGMQVCPIYSHVPQLIPVRGRRGYTQVLSNFTLFGVSCRDISPDSEAMETMSCPCALSRQVAGAGAGRRCWCWCWRCEETGCWCWCRCCVVETCWCWVPALVL